jgi:uncharacterized membrane protein YgdD (TMEM256/DUF423 family)
MSLTSSSAFRWSAVLGFLAVALGAFGAHGLKGMFALRPAAQSWWEKAVLYHFVHTVVLLILACARPLQAGAWLCFAFGILLFSGSLYTMALTNWLWLGIVTPVGGVCFLAGWAFLAGARRMPSL